ncbi:DUF2490 domain-containing protein [Pseudotenacibaculum haliotis]|uniref:DUF2490 domain-containing protein n=1 Tax=Pseudotenacibaculum haliotis TaxID=1862138 RepID=A0ABW5LMW6_9FLAO
MRKALITFSFLILSSLLYAQSSYRLGAIPRININQKLENNWKINYKVESRAIISEGLLSGSSNPNFRYSLTDVSSLVSKKVGLNNSVAVGYLARFREGAIDHRFMQQFTIVSRYNAFRLAHRFATDQTFRKDLSDVFRLRYRIGIEIPLDGYAVDKREFYIKINNEYLNSFSASNHDLEIRLVPLLGYVFEDANKIEFGLDYRTDRFLDNATRNNLWITINWFLSI